MAGSSRVHVADLLLGLAATGVRAGGASARVAVAPVALAARAQVLGPALRGAAEHVAAGGRDARGEARRQLDHAVDRLVASVDVDAALVAVLEHPQTRELVDALTTSPALEQIVADALDSRLTVELTDHLLQGPAMQHAIEHLASSPELRRVVAEQSAGMAEQTLEGVRRRSVVLDDTAERTVRGWLRRPRPQMS